MSKRQAYYRELSDIAKQRLKENRCPNCGKHKDEWIRRKDWTCCSIECTENYYKEHDKSYSWQDFRIKIFYRDNSTCKICNKRFVKKGIILPEVPNESQLIADHIIPIELNGEMWDINNIQTLCIDCNKIKTKEDMGHIAVHRQRFKKKFNELFGQKDKLQMFNISSLEKWF